MPARKDFSFQILDFVCTQIPCVRLLFQWV